MLPTRLIGFILLRNFHYFHLQRAELSGEGPFKKYVIEYNPRLLLFRVNQESEGAPTLQTPG